VQGVIQFRKPQSATAATTAADTAATTARRFGLSSPSSTLYSLFPAARRRNDAVHAQILDHLSVVIEAVSCGKRCLEEARGRPATTPLLRLGRGKQLRG